MIKFNSNNIIYNIFIFIIKLNIMSKFLKNLKVSLNKVKEKEKVFKKLLTDDNFKILEFETDNDNVKIVGESDLYKGTVFWEDYHKKKVTNSMIYLWYNATEKTYNINIRTYYNDKKWNHSHVSLYEYWKDVKKVFKKITNNFYKDFK